MNTLIDPDILITLISTTIASVFASSGFWMWFTTRSKQESNEDKVLKGLAHYRIIEEGERFLDRGWITREEYDDFKKYLVDPYQDMGANGIASIVVDKVKNLSFKSVSDLTEKERNTAHVERSSAC